MGQTKYTVKKKYDPLEELSEMTQDIGFPTDQSSKDFGDTLVMVVENYNNHPIKIIYDGEKVHIKKVYEDDKIDIKAILEVFKKGYIKGFSKIIQEFGQLPFVLFGEFVPNNPIDAFVIYDMNVNDNWISHRDLAQAVANNGFRYPQVLFHGLYDEDVIKKVLSSVPSSLYKEKHVEYAFVKTDMEVDLGYRKGRLGAIISTHTRTEKEKKKEVEESSKKALLVISAYLSALIDASVTDEWKEFLEGEDIEANEENKPLILSFLVDESLKGIKNDIVQISEQHNIDIPFLESAVKKVLPRYIMKALNLK